MVDAKDVQPKAMWFEKLIIAVMQVPAGKKDGKATKPYTKTLVSFQSTGATNISGMNNVPLAKLYVTVKSRGTKPTW